MSTPLASYFDPAMWTGKWREDVDRAEQASALWIDERRRGRESGQTAVGMILISRPPH